MANLPESQRTWAQTLCIEAFAERGVPLSEDDSIILVAAIFRRALDDWKRESDASASVLALAFRRRVEAELAAIATTLAGQLKTELQQGTGFPAAASLDSSDGDRWRYRFEGVCIGAVLAVVIFLVLRFTTH